MAGVAGLEGNRRATQYGEIAVEVEVFGAGGVFFKQGIADLKPSEYSPNAMSSWVAMDAARRWISPPVSTI